MVNDEEQRAIAAGPSREPGAAYEAIDPRPVRRWLLEEAPRLGYSVSEISAAEFDDRYLDTPDWRFHRAGLSLRVRTVADGQLVESRVLPRAHARGVELTGARTYLEGNGVPDLKNCEGLLGERVRSLVGHETLDVRLSLHTRREVFLVARAGADVLQLHVVSAHAPARGEEPPLQVARVELFDVEEGRDASIGAFIEAMQEGCRLRPGGNSTFEAVLFAMGDGPQPLPYVGGVEVTGAMTVAEVAYAVLRRHFLRWLQHEPGTRLGEDIEDLHDMRVSTRRMRAAMKLFRPFLPVRILSLNDSLRWMAAALGEVRDLDVQLENLGDWAESVDERDRGALSVLAVGIGRQRVAARKRLLRALDSKRYERLVERIVRVLRQGPGKQPLEGRQPALAVAPALIERKHGKILKRGKRIDDASPDSDLHSLRIQCKGLRYALEFHSDLYGEPAQRLIRTLVRLQDLLGEHQDACVASDHLREIVEKEGRRVPAQTLFVVGRLAERYAFRAQELRAGFARAFRPLRGKRWERLRRKMRSLGASFTAPPAPPPPRPAAPGPATAPDAR